jgi:hypothetical protein
VICNWENRGCVSEDNGEKGDGISFVGLASLGLGVWLALCSTKIIQVMDFLPHSDQLYQVGISEYIWRLLGPNPARTQRAGGGE